MNTVLVLQPDDVTRLLEIEKVLRELSAEREAILMKAVRTEYTEPEHIDFSMFKDTTRRLLIELWDAPQRMLSKQDICNDVILDEYASNVAVRLVITKAKKEMATHSDFHYVIKNIKRRGYQLVCKETFPNVSNPPKTPRKKRKKIGNS